MDTAFENKINNKSAQSDYTIHPLIKERWSPRVFKEDLIDEKTLMSLFESARWAPSSNNYQPWRFMYAHRGSDGYDKIFDVLSDFNQKWVTDAPLLILTAIKEKFDSGKENYHALHDLGLAVSQFSIQAQDFGVGVHQMAGVDWKKAHQVFGVPDGYHIATALAVGYYGGDIRKLPEDLQKSETAKRTRKPLEEIISEESWIW